MPRALGCNIGNVTVGGGAPLALIAGPCVIEGERQALEAARAIKDICSSRGIPFVYKSSYDKANRSSIGSFRGPGLKKGLSILARVKEEVGVPVLSDVHSESEALDAAKALDALQVPALLSRQTDLLLAAGSTGLPVNVKKGQFMSPWDMGNVVEKLKSSGCRQILLTERGTTFGYNNLVADMRSLVVMARFGYPVVFDATHSLQLPGALGHASGGQREFVPHLARAAVAVGCNALFLEVHPDPERAPCDGPNMLRLEDLPQLLDEVMAIDRVARGAG